MTAPQVLLVIGDAAEATDTLYPYFRVREAGYRCVVAGPEARVYQLVIHDRRPDWDLTQELTGYRFAAEIAFRDVRPEAYLGLVLSGGRAPEYLRYDADLLRITRHFVASGKPIVSTPTAGTERFHDLVKCATTPESFLQALDAALHEDDPTLPELRRTAARMHSWEARIMEVIRILRPICQAHARLQ